MNQRKQSGQILVGVAVALVVLTGFAGLAIDMGTLRYQKRLQQSAADAAAIAGAQNLSTTFGGVVTGGRLASSQNDFTDNDSGGGCTSGSLGCISVAVSDPASGPTMGPHTADPKYVEAIVTAVHPTFFMKIFGVTQKTVVARAVATNVSGGGPDNGCLYTLGGPTSAIEGVNINGNATLNATTCGISDNGNFNTKGNALDVNAGSFGVSGSANQTGPGGSVSCSAPQSSCPIYGVPAVGDPLAGITPPSLPANGSLSGTTYSPGAFNGIHLTGNATYNFSPGTYYMTGDFTCNGTPSIQGTGVMFYFTNGATWNCAGDDLINLTAPNSGQYAGILMYQDPNDTTGPSIGGTVGSSYTGVLYFPKAQATFYGTSTTYSVGIVIAEAFALSGNPTVNMLGTAGLPSGVSILKHAILVE